MVLLCIGVYFIGPSTAAVVLLYQRVLLTSVPALPSILTFNINTTIQYVSVARYRAMVLERFPKNCFEKLGGNGNNNNKSRALNYDTQGTN